MAYMRHVDALDILLANGCGTPEDIDEHVAANREGRMSKSIYKFKMKLHCIHVEIRARMRHEGVLNDKHQWTKIPQYGIISVERDKNAEAEDDA